MRPSLQKTTLKTLLAIVDELQPLLSDLPEARNGLCVSIKKCPDDSSCHAWLAPISPPVSGLGAAFPFKWVRQWTSHRIQHQHGDTSEEQPLMLSLICLGSRDHFGTVLDALPRAQIDSTPPGEVSPSELQQQGEEFQEYIEMRDAVLVEAIVRQSRPPPRHRRCSLHVPVGGFHLQHPGVFLLQASPTALGLVRLLMQLTAYEELDAAQLQSVTDTFSELQPPASLEWLKGTHKSSPILKKHIQHALKRQQLLQSDERQRPKAEELERRLTALESGDTPPGRALW